MSTGLVPFNISLPSPSGIFRWVVSLGGDKSIQGDILLASYLPARDGSASQGWNASFKGSTVWPLGGGSMEGLGSPYFRTQATNSQVSLDFIGVAFVFCASHNGAAFSLSVNDNVMLTQDTALASSDPACDQFGASIALAFFGGLITTNIATDSGSELMNSVMIDDRDAKWDYEGNWHAEPAGSSVAYQSSITYSCDWSADEGASYTFAGASAIILHGLLGPTSHQYTVELDGQKYTGEGVTSWAMQTTVPVFFIANLSNGVHTITVRDYSAANANCPFGRFQCCIILDALELLGTAAAPGSDSSLPPGRTQSLTTGSHGQTPTNTPTAGQGGGLSRSDQIALGVGLGMGIPTLIVGILAAYLQARGRRNPQPELGGVEMNVMAPERVGVEHAK
ncbi:hypothetical protein BKA62DRAFT_764814 [Auriculariales sp. MPI-PUGE-AT-0066]|nr:hypothetical protein BKA62DRAFT_764814 [Auriculariales sp. MPI-PUGE-AT-0066]